MRTKFGFVYPLWNETSPEDLWERILGEVPLSRVVIPAITGPTMEYRLSDSEKRLSRFTADGGWHYPTRPDCYDGLNLEPKRSKWSKKRDYLAQVCDKAGDCGLEIVFEVDLAPLVDGPLASAVVKNAWGDDSPESGICPISAEIRTLVTAIIEDLQFYSPTEIRFVRWDNNVRNATNHTLAWNPQCSALANTCFCAACRQVAATADLDIATVLATVHDEFEQQLVDPQRATAAASPLTVYEQLRSQDQVDWMRQVISRYPVCRNVVDGTKPVQTDAWPMIADLPMHTSSETMASLASRLVSGDHPFVGATLPAWRPGFTDSTALFKVVQDLTKCGLETLDFKGLDVSPEEAITWLKQAVRFAHR